MRVDKTLLIIFALIPLATMAAANQTKKHKVKALPRPVAPAPIPELAPMVGVWTLRNGDVPRTDIKMVFRNSGTFTFIGPNWNSTGSFRIGDHKLSLEWAAVDGRKVAPGTVHKDFPMSDDGGSFTIDRYTYFKLHR